MAKAAISTHTHTHAPTYTHTAISMCKGEGKEVISSTFIQTYTGKGKTHKCVFMKFI